MNSTPEELDELGELARLLPTGPVERGLPSGRHSHHKDVLMQVIDHDHHHHGHDRDLARERDRDRGRRDATDGVRSLPRPRRWSRPALVAGAVAVALAAGLTVGIGAGQREGGGDTAARPGADRTGGADSGGGHSAVVTLDRIAAVALRTDVEAVGEDQFVYVRSRTAGNEGVLEGPVKQGKLQERQVWFSQRAGSTIDVGLIREDGQDWPIEVGVPDGADPNDAGYPAGIERPTYAWLASLPTDPGALLKLLFEQTPRDETRKDRGQAVFNQIGDLLREQIMPSANAAAFYRATARIPGVTELPDAVDAAGRHGIAIAREDTADGTRTEWIFDRSTLDYLGERTVFSRDTERATAGTVLFTSAVLDRAVVDKRGQAPSDRRRAGRS
ncbi:CU044_5270 family protein [Streptomyces sp. ME18-1-4]|uniref:CU044_5270 family protein n=1 Tax=Streptomyces sp. ME18-1-4 TaxID=3028685 RepID=UPI0029AC1A8D|nr:CU044_5270 family protein [Streptomyces sp. ME18-1-4]MDX3246574.1 CU044_5270 family protein [Streptomyces sp. ME18-1-4]